MCRVMCGSGIVIIGASIIAMVYIGVHPVDMMLYFGVLLLMQSLANLRIMDLGTKLTESETKFIALAALGPHVELDAATTTTQHLDSGETLRIVINLISGESTSIVLKSSSATTLTVST